jgi:hypothetical protein
MRSIVVPLELTVRLVRAVEGVENTSTCASFPTLDRCIDALPLTELFAAFCINCIGASAARTAEGQAAISLCPSILASKFIGLHSASLF